MKPDYIFWIAMAAYAIHILEEFTYDWKTWANRLLKMDVSWDSFYLTNTIVLFLGIASAEIGWAHPTLSLIFPALLIIDAIVFHIMPYVRSNRKFSPGMITAIFLFLPIGISSFTNAINMGVTTKSLLIAGAMAALIAAYVFFLLKTKHLSFFKQG